MLEKTKILPFVFVLEANTSRRTFLRDRGKIHEIGALCWQEFQLRSSYPSQLTRKLTHLLQQGFDSSHLTRRFLMIVLSATSPKNTVCRAPFRPRAARYLVTAPEDAYLQVIQPVRVFGLLALRRFARFWGMALNPRS